MKRKKNTRSCFCADRSARGASRIAGFVAGLLLFGVFSVRLAPAQQPVKVTFPYSPINSSSLHWMVAKENGIFEKYGLDVDLVYMGASSLILQSMLSGSANYAGFAGPAIIANVLKGGDVVTVAATTPLTISVMSRPEITRPEDLKGRKIGISRLGAVPHFAIQLILERFGVKDAAILQMGGQSEGAAGLRRGVIDAAVLSLPHTALLAREGYRELMSAGDYKRLGIQFVSGGIAARRGYAAKNRDVTVRLIKATMEGVKVMGKNEAMAKKTFAKYARQSDPLVLNQVYKFAVATVNRDPTIPGEAIGAMARMMADLGLAERAAVTSTPADAYYDASYTEELTRSGFFRDLWK